MKHSAGRPGRSHLLVTAAGLAAVLSFIAAVMTWTHSGTDVAPRPTAAAAPPATAAPTDVARPTIELAPSLDSSKARATTRFAPSQRVSAPPVTELPGAGPPQRVLIDSLGIDAPVLSIVADGSSLTPPGDPQVLGWWSAGAKAGAPMGSALVTGHTVHDGGGALDNLERITPGAVISVRTASGSLRYVADTVDVLDKDTIARKAPELFSQEVDGRLVLVTCEDWDGTGYRSNVVVTAVPVT